MQKHLLDLQAVLEHHSTGLSLDLVGCKEQVHEDCMAAHGVSFKTPAQAELLQLLCLVLLDIVSFCPADFGKMITLSNNENGSYLCTACLVSKRKFVMFFIVPNQKFLNIHYVLAKFCRIWPALPYTPAVFFCSSHAVIRTLQQGRN